MKGLVAVLAAMAAGVVFVAIALIEIVERIAPLLVIGGFAWAVFAVVQARRRRRTVGDQDRLSRVWAHNPASLPPSPSPVPPVTPHRERVYLVAGQDTGFGAHRSDGYLSVQAGPLPAEHRASGHHIRPAGDARAVHRRTANNRPSRRCPRP
ncbi:hypothetical protein PJI20_10145 [Mycobacterium kansasii]